jgi:hypothetical protein
MLKRPALAGCAVMALCASAHADPTADDITAYATLLDLTLREALIRDVLARDNPELANAEARCYGPTTGPGPETPACQLVDEQYMALFEHESELLIQGADAYNRAHSAPPAVWCPKWLDDYAAGNAVAGPHGEDGETIKWYCTNELSRAANH